MSNSTLDNSTIGVHVFGITVGLKVTGLRKSLGVLRLGAHKATQAAANKLKIVESTLIEK